MKKKGSIWLSVSRNFILDSLLRDERLRERGAIPLRTTWWSEGVICYTFTSAPVMIDGRYIMVTRPKFVGNDLRGWRRWEK